MSNIIVQVGNSIKEKVAELLAIPSEARRASALLYLEDEFTARALCYARPIAAADIVDSLQWDDADGCLRRAEYHGVFIFRDLSGYMLGSTAEPVWGVVQIGTRNYRVSSEAQAVAFLLAHFHN